ncbi:MAG: glycosyltransferase family 2 protein [Leptolyngbya sp. PLA2]|nr:glycosyltransferase family 2 protein [Leptolyngbya sp.]MCE7971898.1 glycosyltransferase family 2 protein [Leptolyngbya sp. PL-A2]MCQ3939739.1 glycosyltransferase family 2 protein [cyanobacterium CYA1]MCZ7632012.1 glycosyltransferase family 2 protein [Phycisphaerales bacterium]MDL1903995.1 glycosyltransferase family 2 protein [Synechococcales cyanobacterium CNB]GIK18759.1 MAG: dolichyl-phosphate mannose synthase [Planctomycetota bacterium]
MRTLVAIPVYNEERYVCSVIRRVVEHGHDVLVIDDGSTDSTPRRLECMPVRVIRHATNLGYGRSLRDAFDDAIARRYDWIITMDCDEQHEPDAIPLFIEAAREGTHDVISGSRYLVPAPEDDAPPRDRRAINAEITREVNRRLGRVFREAGGEEITDSFCGFKAMRVGSLRRLHLTESGYAFPMQFWVQAAAARLRIRELAVRLIYNDPTRTFGGQLDDSAVRLAHYRQVLHCELERCADRLPPAALCGVEAGCA